MDYLPLDIQQKIYKLVYSGVIKDIEHLSLEFCTKPVLVTLMMNQHQKNYVKGIYQRIRDRYNNWS